MNTRDQSVEVSRTTVSLGVCTGTAVTWSASSNLLQSTENKFQTQQTILLGMNTAKYNTFFSIRNDYTRL